MQGGFRESRSRTDQLFAMRQLREKVIEKEMKMVMACVDLEKPTTKWEETSCAWC